MHFDRNWLLMALILLALGCERSLECLSDADCESGQYCMATACRAPEPLPDRTAAYVQQIAPLIEANCGCHGEGLGRPWSYDHESFEPDAIDGNLRSIAQWAYDGHPDSNDTNAVGFSFMGFALARCGFAHPGIFSNATHPQYVMLSRFIETFGASFPESPRDDDALFPESLGAGPEMTALDTEIDQIIEKPYAEALREDIIPRVVGQCGCCHQQGGERGFQLALGTIDDPMAFEFNAEVIELDVVDRVTPDFSPIIEYGLGYGGRSVAHPVIYTSIDDPRLHLIRRWIEEGSPPPS